MNPRPVTVAETSVFVRQANEVWSEQDRCEFITYIASNPLAGDIVPNTGGVRKIRWGRQGSGKRGGVRVIYFYYDDEAPLYLMMIYAKATNADLLPTEKQAVTKLTAIIKQKLRAKKE